MLSRRPKMLLTDVSPVRLPVLQGRQNRFRHGCTMPVCQPQINAVSQNGGQQQPSVFWPDVIIFEVREVTRKTSPTVDFFQYFCNFRMGEHAINQTGWYYFLCLQIAIRPPAMPAASKNSGIISNSAIPAASFCRKNVIVVSARPAVISTYTHNRAPAQLNN